MADEESTEHQFVQSVLSNFTPLQSQLGEEAYKANVANMYANAELMKSSAAVRRALVGMLTLLTMLLMVAGIALVVGLWKLVLAL